MTGVRTILLSLAALLAAAVPAAAQSPTPTPTPSPTPAPPPVIAAGVNAGGIDVSGLSVPDATARLQQVAGPILSGPIVVSVAGRRFTLTPRQVHLRFDAARSAERAYEAGQRGTPAFVPLAVSFRRSVVDRFVATIARRVRVRPRDADLRLTLTRMIPRPERPGRELDVAFTRAAVRSALVAPTSSRRLTPARLEVPAKRGVASLPKRYPTVLTVDREHFKLRLFKRLKLVKTYRIAVGAAGYDTPAGRYAIQNKAVNPAWSAPNAPWAGLYAGRTVPGGAPDNPLKARWLGIANGVGIHGTGDPGSIGSRASHGCIRMTVPDVIDLYPRVPVGTPVLIG